MPKMHTIVLNLSQGVIDEWRQKTSIVRLVGGVATYADAIMSEIVDSIEKKSKEMSLSLKKED